MAKLGYTWYPKDWGSSDGVFELNLSERGLYRELIDLAMLNDNKTEIKLDVWSRKFAIDIDGLKSILGKLSLLSLIEVNGDNLFIPSCESRLNLVRGGSNGGKKSKPPIKPDSKPNDKPATKQTKKKPKKESESKYFRDSDLFDKVKFKEAFPDWQRDKLAFYYDAALRWSDENDNKLKDWKAAVRSWAKKDELQGKLKFASKNNNNQLGGLLT